MVKIIKNLFFIILLLPAISLAQFTGFQDETVSSVNWTANSDNVSTQNDVYTNSNTGFTSNGSDIKSDASLKTNIGTGKCNVSAKSIKGYVEYFGCAVRVSVLPFILGIAIVAFVYGVVKMISNAANEEAQSQGRTFIIWGIIGFFVIVSVYALVGVIRRTIGFGFNAKDDTTPYVQLKDKVKNIK